MEYSDWKNTPNKDYVRDDGIKQVYFQDPDGYWIETQKIEASDNAAHDYFGSSVSIYDSYLAISAEWQDTDNNGLDTLNNAGAVYIYEKDIEHPKIVSFTNTYPVCNDSLRQRFL